MLSNYHLFMIFAVFDAWLLTQWIYCSFYHLYLGLLFDHQLQYILLARNVIYTSRAYATMSVRLSVRLSVTEVHWRIIANLGFKFRSHFTAHWPPCCAAAVLLAGESSRAMLASARLCCST